MAASDPDFRSRMESDPRGTMIEHGISESLVDDILEPEVEGHMMMSKTSLSTTCHCA